LPEGPEVRREADRIAAALVGKRLAVVEFGLSRLERHKSELAGARVSSVETRGKAMLTHFDNGLTLYSHNQLYGKWVVCRAGKAPATNRSLRVGLHTSDHSALLYSASEIEVLDHRLVEEHPFLRKLGPDVLNASLTWRNIAARLQAPEFRRRSLASLYLDQGFLAGIGNYLRSEILHEASQPPLRKAGDLTRGETGALARATLLISQRAYQDAGVTNAPGRVRTLKRLGYPRREYRFAVFAREGLPCYRCGERIVRIEISSRRLYYCSGCQSKT
jgi:endonuclease-8